MHLYIGQVQVKSAIYQGERFLWFSLHLLHLSVGLYEALFQYVCRTSYVTCGACMYVNVSLHMSLGDSIIIAQAGTGMHDVAIKTGGGALTYHYIHSNIRNHSLLKKLFIIYCLVGG